MKTNANLSNLKKVVVTMSSALVFTAVSFAGSASASVADEGQIALSRLEAKMIVAEESARYSAPAVDEITSEMERLDVLADQTEVALKYVAPAVTEEDVFTPEMVRLEILAAATEASIRFTAPRADETPSLEVVDENTAKMMAENIK